MIETERDALEGLLHWYAAMGVDAAVDEEPHDRFQTRDDAGGPSAVTPPRAPIPTTAEPAPVLRRSVANAPAEAQVLEAQASAAAAHDLDDLARRWAALPGFGLAASATRMVMAGGTLGSRLMLIGGAPEADDERRGEILAGDRGLLLDRMLAAIGLDRTRVYLANLIPWRPPGARAPTPLEVALCLPFARRHVALADPAILVCLGERAAQPLLGSRDPLSRLRGRWLTFEGDAKPVRAMVTFAPDYLLKQPLQKRRAWSDLQMLAAALAGD